MKTFPVRVWWGGQWVKTEGTPEGKSSVMARVYDPTAREWCVKRFGGLNWLRGHEPGGDKKEKDGTVVS